MKRYPMLQISSLKTQQHHKITAGQWYLRSEDNSEIVPLGGRVALLGILADRPKIVDIRNLQVTHTYYTPSAVVRNYVKGQPKVLSGRELLVQLAEPSTFATLFVRDDQPQAWYHDWAALNVGNRESLLRLTSRLSGSVPAISMEIIANMVVYKDRPMKDEIAAFNNPPTEYVEYYLSSACQEAREVIEEILSRHTASEQKLILESLTKGS